jgi:putative hemolysin
MAYRQHKQIQAETDASSRYTNAAVAQPADKYLAGAVIAAFANLATATAVDRGIVATLTEANSHSTKQLEDSSQTLKEIRALLKNERNDRSSRRTFAPPNENYCWTHGYKIAINHTSENCVYPKTGHKREADQGNNLGDSQANKE